MTSKGIKIDTWRLQFCGAMAQKVGSNKHYMKFNFILLSPFLPRFYSNVLSQLTSLCTWVNYKFLHVTHFKNSVPNGKPANTITKVTVKAYPDVCNWCIQTDLSWRKFQKNSVSVLQCLSKVQTLHFSVEICLRLRAEIRICVVILWKAILLLRAGIRISYDVVKHVFASQGS